MEFSTFLRVFLWQVLTSSSTVWPLRRSLCWPLLFRVETAATVDSWTDCLSTCKAAGGVQKDPVSRWVLPVGPSAPVALADVGSHKDRSAHTLNFLHRLPPNWVKNSLFFPPKGHAEIWMTALSPRSYYRGVRTATSSWEKADRTGEQLIVMNNGTNLVGVWPLMLFFPPCLRGIKTWAEVSACTLIEKCEDEDEGRGGPPSSSSSSA